MTASCISLTESACLDYLFCPGGALPVGVTLVVGTPFALPFGVLPPPLICSLVIAPPTTRSNWSLVSFTGSASARLTNNAQPVLATMQAERFVIYTSHRKE